MECVSLLQSHQDTCTVSLLWNVYRILQKSKLECLSLLQSHQYTSAVSFYGNSTQFAKIKIGMSGSFAEPSRYLSSIFAMEFLPNLIKPRVIEMYGTFSAISFYGISTQFAKIKLGMSGSFAEPSRYLGSIFLWNFYPICKNQNWNVWLFCRAIKILVQYLCHGISTQFEKIKIGMSGAFAEPSRYLCNIILWNLDPICKKSKLECLALLQSHQDTLYSIFAMEFLPVLKLCLCPQWNLQDK